MYVHNSNDDRNQVDYLVGTPPPPSTSDTILYPQTEELLSPNRKTCCQDLWGTYMELHSIGCGDSTTKYHEYSKLRGSAPTEKNVSCLNERIDVITNAAAIYSLKPCWSTSSFMNRYAEALMITKIRRPVGWSGDGGVRESNKVELIKSGGGSRRGRSPSRPARGYGGAL